MYNDLTATDSLFLVEHSHITRFQQLATTTPMYEDLTVHVSLHTKSKWGVIFNFWCLFIENEENLLMNDDKMMIYSSNFYAIHLVRHYKPVQYFLLDHPSCEASPYILAYYIGTELMAMLQSYTVEDEQFRAIYTKYDHDEYFVLYYTEKNNQAIDHSLYVDQKIFTALFAHSYHTTKEFQRRIASALQRARIHMNRLTRKECATTTKLGQNPL